MNQKRKFPTKAAILVAAIAASLFLDNAATEMVESIRTPAITGLVGAFNKYFFWIYGAMLAATFAAVFKSRKKEKERRLAAMTFSILGAMTLTYLLKPILHRIRPDGAMFLGPVFGNVDYSFPSGHVTSAAAAAFSAPALRMPWAAFAAATVAARIYSNAHFLSDTVAGVAVAAGVAALINGRMKKNLTSDDNFEIRRQLVHASVGICIAMFVAKYPALWPVLLVIAGFGLLLSWTIRSAAAKKGFLKSFVTALTLVERKDAFKKFPGKGAIMLFLGSGITAALFKEGAVAAILILAIGDSVSPIAGRLLGKARHRWIFADEKMIEGTFFGIAFATAATALIMPAWIALIASTAAMLVEAMHIRILGRKIDDNITVPIVAAVIIMLL